MLRLSFQKFQRFFEHSKVLVWQQFFIICRNILYFCQRLQPKGRSRIECVPGIFNVKWIQIRRCLVVIMTFWVSFEEVSKYMFGETLFLRSTELRFKLHWYLLLKVLYSLQFLTQCRRSSALFIAIILLFSIKEPVPWHHNITILTFVALESVKCSILYIYVTVRTAV